MDPANKTKPVVEADKSGDPHEDKGETFWILVYVFMAFAIFEVLCVALFFIYRYRRKRKQRRYEYFCFLLEAITLKVAVFKCMFTPLKAHDAYILTRVVCLFIGEHRLRQPPQAMVSKTNKIFILKKES